MALSLFDHYHFRIVQAQAKTQGQPLTLKRPPRAPGETPWFEDDYSVPYKIRDRKLFA